MTGEAIMISSRSRFLSITVLLAMLGGVTLTDALAFVTELTATPAEPGCEDEVTLAMGDLGSRAQSDPFLLPNSGLPFRAPAAGRYIVQVAKLTCDTNT